VEKQRKEHLPKIIDCFEPKNMYNAGETKLFFRLQSNRTLGLKGDACSDGKKSNFRIMVLFTCSVNGNYKL
jgi:hypothetical protein